MKLNPKLPITEQIFEINVEINKFRTKLNQVADIKAKILKAKKAGPSKMTKSLLQGFLDKNVLALKAEVEAQVANANAALSKPQKWNVADEVVLERALEKAVEQAVKKVKKSNPNASLGDFDREVAKDKKVAAAKKDYALAMALSVSNVSAQIKRSDAAAKEADKAQKTAAQVKKACQELSKAYLDLIPIAKVAGLQTEAAKIGLSFRDLVGPAGELVTVTKKLSSKAKALSSTGTGIMKSYKKKSDIANSDKILEKLVEKFI